MKKGILKLFIAALLLALAVPSYASYVYVTVSPAYYSGTRALSTGGLTVGGAWAYDTPTLSWEITDLHNGFYSYAYTWSATPGNLSHIILEVSTEATSTDFKNFKIEGASIAPQDLATYSESGANPNMPGSLWSLKINTDGLANPVTVYFESTHLPMWGDFYAKDGQAGQQGWNTAWNSGFGTDPTTATLDFTNWVAVPDTKTIHQNPLPSALWLLGAGFLGLVGIRRKMTKA